MVKDTQGADEGKWVQKTRVQGSRVFVLCYNPAAKITLRLVRVSKRGIKFCVYHDTCQSIAGQVAMPSKAWNCKWITNESIPPLVTCRNKSECSPLSTIPSLGQACRALCALQRACLREVRYGLLWKNELHTVQTSDRASSKRMTLCTETQSV
jgi:hypothetical protein